MTIAEFILNTTGVNVFSPLTLSTGLAFAWVLADDLKESDSGFPEYLPKKWFYNFLRFLVWVKNWKK